MAGRLVGTGKTEESSTITVEPSVVSVAFKNPFFQNGSDDAGMNAFSDQNPAENDCNRISGVESVSRAEKKNAGLLVNKEKEKNLMEVSSAANVNSLHNMVSNSAAKLSVGSEDSTVDPSSSSIGVSMKDDKKDKGVPENDQEISENDFDYLEDMRIFEQLEHTGQPKGPMEWIMRQMSMDTNPREIISHLIHGVTVPSHLDDLTLWKVVWELITEPKARAKLDDVNTIEDVTKLIEKSNKIIVLTGAGVSVSCGIPDFRSRDGIYARLSKDFPDLPDPQSMFDIHYFRRDQRPFFKFAKEIYPGQFEPSLSHMFIAALDKKGKLLRNYTQNIDTLEQTAGIQQVVQCHGSFATASCTNCKEKVSSDAIREDIFNQVIPQCKSCDPDESTLAVMKPDIIFFGEGLPDAFYQNLDVDKLEADLLIVIGSSLKVRPVALIPDYLKPNVPQILINREPLHHFNFDVELLGNCDAVIAELCRRLGEDWSEVTRDYVIPPLDKEAIEMMFESSSESGSSENADLDVGLTGDVAETFSDKASGEHDRKYEPYTEISDAGGSIETKTKGDLDDCSVEVNLGEIMVGSDSVKQDQIEETSVSVIPDHVMVKEDDPVKPNQEMEESVPVKEKKAMMENDSVKQDQIIVESDPVIPNQVIEENDQVKQEKAVVENDSVKQDQVMAESDPVIPDQVIEENDQVKQEKAVVENDSVKQDQVMAESDPVIPGQVIEENDQVKQKKAVMENDSVKQDQVMEESDPVIPGQVIEENDPVKREKAEMENDSVKQDQVMEESDPAKPGPAICDNEPQDDPVGHNDNEPDSLAAGSNTTGHSQETVDSNSLPVEENKSRKREMERGCEKCERLRVTGDQDGSDKVVDVEKGGKVSALGNSDCIGKDDKLNKEIRVECTCSVRSKRLRLDYQSTEEKVMVKRNPSGSDAFGTSGETGQDTGKGTSGKRKSRTSIRPSSPSFNRDSVMEKFKNEEIFYLLVPPNRYIFHGAEISHRMSFRQDSDSSSSQNESELGGIQRPWEEGGSRNLGGAIQEQDQSAGVSTDVSPPAEEKGGKSNGDLPVASLLNERSTETVSKEDNSRVTDVGAGSLAAAKGQAGQSTGETGESTAPGLSGDNAAEIVPKKDVSIVSNVETGSLVEAKGEQLTGERTVPGLSLEGPSMDMANKGLSCKMNENSLQPSTNLVSVPFGTKEVTGPKSMELDCNQKAGTSSDS